MVTKIDDDYCKQLGLDPTKVIGAVRRINIASRELSSMGLVIFGGSGTGTLRKMSFDPNRILATFDGDFDGGDGGLEHWD